MEEEGGHGHDGQAEAVAVLPRGYAARDRAGGEPAGPVALLDGAAGVAPGARARPTVPFGGPSRPDRRRAAARGRAASRRRRASRGRRPATAVARASRVPQGKVRPRADELTPAGAARPPAGSRPAFALKGACRITLRAHRSFGAFSGSVAAGSRSVNMYASSEC